MTELYGRTFAIWTVTTCVLCLICARDPTIPAIYGKPHHLQRHTPLVVQNGRLSGACGRRRDSVQLRRGVRSLQHGAAGLQDDVCGNGRQSARGRRQASARKAPCFASDTLTASIEPLTLKLWVTGVSVVWMGLGWSYYTNYARYLCLPCAKAKRLPTAHCPAMSKF